MTVRDRVENMKDKVKGKTNEIVGDVRNDPAQKMKGRMQEAKGDVKDVGTDIKESFKDR